MTYLSWTTFFWYKPLWLLSSTYWPFSLWKILKSSYSGSFAQNNFFCKIITIMFIYLLAPFILQNFKKILPSDPELWGCAIFGPKMSPFPKWEFFQKSCLWASFLLFMPIYMPKIKFRYYSISEILMIKEYWDLIGPKPFLSLTWKIDFFQACSFCRMLINHKNSDFTLIPDKTSYMILLKIPKTMFLGHFWPFLPDEDSLKKIQRCYRQLHMGP